MPITGLRVRVGEAWGVLTSDDTDCTVETRMLDERETISNAQELAVLRELLHRLSRDRAKVFELYRARGGTVEALASAR